MIYLVAAIIVVIVGFALLIMGVFEAKIEAPDPTQARLGRIGKPQGTLADQRRAAKQHTIDREFVRREEQRATVRKTTYLPGVSNVITTNRMLAKLEEDLVQAKSPWRASELLAGSVLLALAMFSLLTYFVWIVIAIPVAIACLFIPWIYVKIARATYYRKFDEQLADAMMLVANSLKAGFSFMQGMEMLSREAPYPIADEFQRVTQEMAVGIPVIEALNNLSDRVKSMDLQLLVTAVGIQYEIGGTLAEILETIAHVIHERIRIRQEIRVLTTQGRMTGLFLTLMPMMLGVTLHFVSKAGDAQGHSFMEPLWTESIGQMMLGLALVMQIIGGFCISKIVDIKV